MDQIFQFCRKWENRLSGGETGAELGGAGVISKNSTELTRRTMEVIFFLNESSWAIFSRKIPKQSSWALFGYFGGLCAKFSIFNRFSASRKPIFPFSAKLENLVQLQLELEN